MRFRWLKTLGVVSVLAVTAGCSVNPATGGRDFVLMSEEEEIQIGAQAANQIAREFDVYDDEKLQTYVNAVGQRLAAVGERAHLTYTFTVLDAPEVNAFALPAGHIYITRGLLTYMNSEAQLAAVLGHELGHVTARHAARQQGTAAVTGLLSDITAAATGVRGSEYLTSAVGKAVVSGYGRGMELEADHLGAVYMARTGYAPDAVIEVLSILKAQEAFETQQAEAEGRTPRSYHGLFATHPTADTRLREVIESAGDVQAAGDPIENRTIFLKNLDGVVYGENRPNAGGAVGEYLNPEMGVALKMPIGWRVQSSAKSVKAQSRGNDGMLQLAVQKMSRRDHPREFLLKRLGADAKLVREEEFTTAGLPGYTAVALGAPSPYGDRAVRYGIVYMGREAYIFAGTTKELSEPYKYDREVVQAIRSLRPLTTNEKRAAAPAVIRVVRVGEGTTIAHLADASRLTKYAEEHIRLINGLYPDGEPQPGDYIKTLE